MDKKTNYYGHYNLTYQNPIRRNIYKWWCVVYKPVFKLFHEGRWPMEKEPAYVFATTEVQEAMQAQNTTTPDLSSITNEEDSETAVDNTSNSNEGEFSSLDSSEIPADVDDDVLSRANEIMARLNQEAAEDEAKKQGEIDKARAQADYDARIAEIMHANSRDSEVHSYIETGLHNRNN